MREEGRRSRRPSRLRAARAAFYLHLWFGVVITVMLVAIAVTGILLNHKQSLGLMPDVASEGAAPLGTSLPLERLVRAALEASPTEATGGWKRADPVDAELIDRMDVRPRDGFVKVRLRDRAVTEVTVALASGKVLHVGRRGDVFLERLHSGEALGSSFVLLSDFAAGGLIVTLITGYWLWLVPKLGRRYELVTEDVA